MSNPVPRRGLGKLLKPLDRIQNRSRTPSPAATAVPVRDGLASGSIARVTPTVGVASVQPLSAAPAKQISPEDVLEMLEPKQQSILLKHGTKSLDPQSTVQDAIKVAEEKKQTCINERWRINVGNKTIVLRDKADTVVEFLNKFKDIGTTIAGLDPVHAGLPWAGICLLLQVSVASKEQMDALMNGILVALSMQQTADVYLGFYNDQPAGLQSDDLRRYLLSLYATILGFLAEALRLLDANGPTRFCNALRGNDELQEFPSRCSEGLEDVERAASNCDRQLAARTTVLVRDFKTYLEDIVGQVQAVRAQLEHIGRKIDLTKLLIAEGAQYDAYDPKLTSCLEGTRVDLLEEITHWIDNPTGECLFWLQGITGEGKSTIAKTVATTLHANKKLGASFFFKRDREPDRADARKFFTTIGAPSRLESTAQRSNP